jgi:hypothetical protein
MRRPKRPDEPYRASDLDHDDYDGGLGELLHLLKQIERHRQEADCELANLQDLLRRSTTAAKVWAEFTDRGGLSAAEFECYLAGKQFRHRRTRRKKHLCLVASAPINLTVIPRRQSRYGGTSGDDAA